MSRPVKPGGPREQEEERRTTPAQRPRERTAVTGWRSFPRPSWRFLRPSQPHRELSGPTGGLDFNFPTLCFPAPLGQCAWPRIDKRLRSCASCRNQSLVWQNPGEGARRRAPNTRPTHANEQLEQAQQFSSDRSMQRSKRDAACSLSHSFAADRRTQSPGTT